MHCRFASHWRLILTRTLSGLGVILGLALFGPGCKPSADTAKDRVPPNPNRPAAYGSPKPLETLPAVRLREPAAAGTNWQASPFFVLQTELSPATLVHSSTKYLGLFAGMTNAGLSAPTYLAWPTMNGPRTFKRGESITVTNMAQNWILVWWTGATGWTSWDCPWVVFLQHAPSTMHLDDDGLHLEFPRAAGDVVLMPLYGYDKLPQEGHDFRAAHGLPASKVQNKTWEWPKVVTRDPLTRIRYWGSALREFPIYCEDTFRVDGAKDSVTIRSRFQWRSIEDDWKTPHLKLAPISPPLAHAVKIGGFPVTISKPWFDFNFPTPHGPYVAIEGVDEFEATFPVLQYVNETEASQLPPPNAPAVVPEALQKLRQLAASSVAKSSISADPIDPYRQVAVAARSLPFLDAGPRSNTATALRTIVRDDLFVPQRFKSRRDGAAMAREHLTLASDVARSLPDAAGSNQRVLEALWAYAHYSGDWDLVRERWATFRQLFIAPATVRWAGFGGDGTSAESGYAAGAIAFARLAYQAGDFDAYEYGCSVLARELTLAFVRQRGADYVRKNQPWHSLELIDEDVFLTRLKAEDGWGFDGPKYPAGGASARQFHQRWRHYTDGDLARFFRDYLRGEVERELNWLEHGPAKGSPGVASGRLSVPALRSVLLHVIPQDGAAIATSENSSSSPSNPELDRRCLAILHSAQPSRFERLIPPTRSASFKIGLEREVPGPNLHLLTTITAEKPSPNLISSASVPDWPQLRWLAWRTPTGAAWTFGQIRPVKADAGAPTKVESVPLNWNTRALSFSLP